jgi:hypothetical protein
VCQFSKGICRGRIPRAKGLSGSRPATHVGNTFKVFLRDCRRASVLTRPRAIKRFRRRASSGWVLTTLRQPENSSPVARSPTFVSPAEMPAVRLEHWFVARNGEEGQCPRALRNNKRSYPQKQTRPTSTPPTARPSRAFPSNNSLRSSTRLARGHSHQAGRSRRATPARRGCVGSRRRRGSSRLRP